MPVAGRRTGAARTEAELLPGVAAQVQLVGFGVGLGVPVGRRQVDDDALAGPDGFTADLDILDGDAALSVLDDRQVAHQLLARVGDDLGILGIAQEVGLLRILQQREDADADHIGGGLVPGDQQTGTQLGGLLHADLAGGHPFGQIRHRVLGGIGLLLLDQVDQVLVQAHRAFCMASAAAYRARPALACSWKNSWSS